MKSKLQNLFSLFFILGMSSTVYSTTNSISIHSASPVSGANVISSGIVGLDTSFYIAWDFTTTGSVPVSGVLESAGDATNGDVVTINASSPVNVSGNRYYIVFKVQVNPDQSINFSKIKFDLKAYDNSFPLNTIESVSGHILSTNQVLPVQLIAFSANPISDNNAIKLEWSTASESNSHYFLLEKCENGNDFVNIAKIPAMGISNSIQNYHYDDVTSKSSKKIIYRLKLVNIDGTEELLDIKKVFLKTHHEFEVIGANPILGNQIHLKINEAYFNGSIHLIDLKGVLMSRHPLNNSHNSIDVSGLNSGFYFLKYIDEYGLEGKSIKVVIP